MHIYCFYTNTLHGLEPSLYSFTDKKAVADEFAESRKGLRRLTKDVTPDEFRDMRDKLGSIYIIPEELTTRDNRGKKAKIKIYATAEEIIDFRAHSDAIATLMLSMYAVDTSVFVDDLKEVLDAMGMNGCYAARDYPGCDARFGYCDSVNFEEVFQPRLWVGNYCLDELYVFVHHRWYTFFDDIDELS